MGKAIGCDVSACGNAGLSWKDFGSDRVRGANTDSKLRGNAGDADTLRDKDDDGNSDGAISG